MVELSKRNAAQEGVGDKATFAKADLYESDFSQASVITMFLLPSINLKLRPKILDLKPGTRIVSNSFTMGDWNPDETFTITEDCTTWCTALLWIVPAKVAGHWQLADGELTLTQTFQQVTGTVKTGSNVSVIKNGKLNGDEISSTRAKAITRAGSAAIRSREFLRVAPTGRPRVPAHECKPLHCKLESGARVSRQILPRSALNHLLRQAFAIAVLLRRQLCAAPRADAA